MIEQDKLILLAQIVDSVGISAEGLEQAYAKNDKRKFELAKDAILDFQEKISFLLK